VPDPHPLPVRTERRLLLRASTPDDVEATWVFRRLPQVAEWITEQLADLAVCRAEFTDPDRLATTRGRARRSGSRNRGWQASPLACGSATSCSSFR
jgi:hypothetical protein